MRRRTYLRGAGGGLVLGTTGCLGVNLGGGDGSADDSGTYLDRPELEYDGDLEAFAYPRWSDPLPEATVPAPLHGEDVTTTQFDAAVVMSFFYSHCNTVCPRLIGTLRNIQTRANEDGYGDDLRFLAVTFDPQRDTADRLEAYADQMNVDLETGNWYFLRPASESRARAVVTELFGVGFERTTPENMDGYMFTHMGLIVLANGDGVVERGYSTTEPAWQDIYDDVSTLCDREG